MCFNVLKNHIESTDLIIKKDPSSKRKLIGNTPFTALHIQRQGNLKNDVFERRMSKEILLQVILCFSPNTDLSEIAEFVIPKNKRSRFKHNHVYIHFPKDGLMKIAGYPKTIGYSLLKLTSQ